MDRKEELLRATYEILGKIYDSNLQDALAETAHYDEADCDGYCLMIDIAHELDLPEPE